MDRVHVESSVYVQAHYKEKGTVPEEEAQIHRIRITLTSRNVKSLEKGRFGVENSLHTSGNLLEPEYQLTK